MTHADRLGPGFARLWSAATISSFGDGVTQIGATLLTVSITRDPLAVSGLMIAQVTPFLVFGLPSGVLVDRSRAPLWLGLACAVVFTLPAWRTLADHSIAAARVDEAIEESER